MPQSKPNLFWPLRLIAAASLIAPALLFAYATWANYRSIQQRSTERVESALDVIQEHALKALQTTERTIAETNEVLRGFSDDEIRRQEERFSRRLKQSHEALPQMQSIWAFARDGRPLVSSTIYPVPPTLNNADRDYFRAQLDGRGGTFIGDIVQARVGSLRFFVVSGRRPETEQGGFNGVIGITVLPDHFREFYGRLSRGVADSFGLIRGDGAFLARYPALLDRPARLGPESAFVRGLQTDKEAGRFTVTSELDGVERQIGYRRVPGYPIYVQAGIETAAMQRELTSTMASHLTFGVPASLTIFGFAIYALRRAEGFRAEVVRREAAEAALKQAQRLEAVGQLTGGVAHDFNNLLTVITGNAERLRRYPVADERQRRALEAIDTAAKRGANLTRQLLSFSRRQTHEPTAVDLAENFPQLDDMLRSSLRGDITLETRIADDLWATKIDLSEFELAILNITVNARDAMPNGGRLTIAAQNVRLSDTATIGLSGEFVALSFTDSGTGIPPEVVSRVFEPFFTTKEVGKGTGLGLSQVYGFARQSGGTATIASQPGQGTTVTLYLPRTTESPQREAEMSSTAVPKRREGRGRVLVVEDNHDVADIARGHLEELGYTVVRAADVAAATAVLNNPDSDIVLVFSDIVMPGERNGLDFARAVRQEHGAKIPVLLATGYSEVAQAAADEGFPILRKPFDLAQLREALAKLIRASRIKVVA